MDINKKLTINIVDNTFRHDYGTCPSRVEYPFNWLRHSPASSNRIYTDSNIGEVKNSDSSYNGILTIESRGIKPEIYDLVKEYEAYIDVIFTHDSELLNLFPHKAIFKPGGSVGFIGDHIFNESDKNLWQKKSSLCSFLLSSKQFCPMHSARVAYAIAAQKHFGDKIDISMHRKYALKSKLGALFKKNPTWVIPHSFTKDIPSVSRGIPYRSVLEKYMFTISIENYIDKSFFTEKLLSPFAMQCIPIYKGATEIASFFDSRGFLTFNSEDELLEILEAILLHYILRCFHTLFRITTHQKLI